MKTPREIIQAVVKQAQPFNPEGESAQAPYQPRQVVLSRASGLTPTPVRWLWKHWLARGKLHILAGPPGQGKTTIAMSLAATVSTGGMWPDGTQCEPGNVLIWSGEDDPADTLLPRLIAAGADPARCYFIEGVREAGEVHPFDPAIDFARLEAAAQEVGDVRFLLVDPVVSAVAGDDNKNSGVRRSLQPLVDLAAKIDLAVLGISHFSKGGAGNDPTSRVVGSVAYSAVARVVMVAAKMPNSANGSNRVLARSKSNIGPDNGGFEYSTDQIEILDGIQASYVKWGNAIEGNALDLLAEPEETGERPGELSDIMELLKGELVDDNWTPANDVKKRIEQMGFTNKQVWKASTKLGVIRKKVDMTGGWYWRLPPGTGNTEAEKDA